MPSDNATSSSAMRRMTTVLIRILYLGTSAWEAIHLLERASFAAIISECYPSV